MSTLDCVLQNMNVIRFGSTGFVVSPLSDTDAMRAHSLHRCKILHLVRHAQGIHNVEGTQALLSQEFFDAELSPLGWQQVRNLRKDVQASGLTKKIDLVITSPMSRTLQTAVGVFGRESRNNGSGLEPSMAGKVENESYCASPSIDCPPIIAVELCRERLGLHPCDKRRSVSEYQTRFPTIDFKLIESEDDNLWKADTREPVEEVTARGMKFIKWLWARQEKEIAVVSHGIFLQQTLIELLTKSNSAWKNQFCTRFRNCELRSVVIEDTSTLEPSYPGYISRVLNLPSDVTKDTYFKE